MLVVVVAVIVGMPVVIGFVVSVAAGCFWGALFCALYRISNPKTPEVRRRAARIFARIAVATTCFAASVYALAGKTVMTVTDKGGPAILHAPEPIYAGAAEGMVKPMVKAQLTSTARMALDAVGIFRLSFKKSSAAPPAAVMRHC